jgi:hypothetical protein
MNVVAQPLRSSNQYDFQNLQVANLGQLIGIALGGILS